MIASYFTWFILNWFSFLSGDIVDDIIIPIKAEVATSMLSREDCNSLGLDPQIMDLLETESGAKLLARMKELHTENEELKKQLAPQQATPLLTASPFHQNPSSSSPPLPPPPPKGGVVQAVGDWKEKEYLKRADPNFLKINGTNIVASFKNYSSQEMFALSKLLLEKHQHDLLEGKQLLIDLQNQKASAAKIKAAAADVQRLTELAAKGLKVMELQQRLIDAICDDKKIEAEKVSCQNKIFTELKTSYDRFAKEKSKWHNFIGNEIASGKVAAFFTHTLERSDLSSTVATNSTSSSSAAAKKVTTNAALSELQVALIHLDSLRRGKQLEDPDYVEDHIKDLRKILLVIPNKKTLPNNKSRKQYQAVKRAVQDYESKLPYFDSKDHPVLNPKTK
ncbi:MAG: hypothetical protein HQK50_00725 [Oligoflexia bacterium]|nr:hypothetical protein [Oligoflexia bacterium]